jgi:hypothetical protein
MPSRLFRLGEQDGGGTLLDRNIYLYELHVLCRFQYILCHLLSFDLKVHFGAMGWNGN